MDVRSKDDDKCVKKGNKEDAIPPKDDEPIVDVKTLPFPQRFMRRNLDKQFGKFLDYLKEIIITIPFVDAIRDMPVWGKFLKDIISHKSKLEDYVLVSLVEESKAMYSKSLPKLKDPSSFTVPCAIGGTHFDKLYVILVLVLALCLTLFTKGSIWMNLSLPICVFPWRTNLSHIHLAF